MSIIERIKSRYRWTWVGTVEGRCSFVQASGTRAYDNRYWNLYVRGCGKRKAVVAVRGSSMSAHIQETKAAVDAWTNGGPLPTLFKSPAPVRQTPKLISFPGGKGRAE